jgi:hypothetical protein
MSTPVKFRAEDMAMASSNINKYVTHYPTSTTHLQYGYNQQADNQKTSYVHTTNAVGSITSSHVTSSELSQDITSLLLKEQSSDSKQRAVLQGSTVADYLSHLPTLHHFLKYSDAIKKESVTVSDF